MAMLAEPRRKQKLSLDPRNRMWRDDQNKFGKRMMEKMGWSSGKGLGANEDGKTDHIKVSIKNNTLGVGCTPSHEDNWIAHQDDFNDILATLNQDHSKEDGDVDDKPTEETDESASKSLEERSKKSRSRVHYKKFTRGKDLSKYGATDINCILGVRANRSAPTTPKTQSVNNSDNEGDGDKSSQDEHEDTSHGITTVIQNTSINDYFAKKMAELKRGRQQQTKDNESDGKEINEGGKESNEDGKESNEDREESNKGSVQDGGDHESKTRKKKKKRKSKREETCDDENGVNSKKDQDIEQDVNISDGKEDEQPRKKKSKRNQKELEPMTSLEEQHGALSTSSKRSKKKKKKNRKSIE